MNEAPFGLPRELFSILMVVAWLVLGPLVAGWFMRRRRIVSAGSFSQPAEQPPPVYPAMSPPTQPYAELVGLLHYKSITRWFVLIPGVFAVLVVIQLPILTALPIGAVVLLMIVFFLWRPTLAVQQCNIDHNLAFTFIRGGRAIPLGFSHYRYARMHVSTSRFGMASPSMLVFSRDSRPGLGTLLSSMLFPRVDDRRIVLFYNRWWTADRGLILPGILDDFFRDACRRAGYEPQFRKTMFGGQGGWEVRPY